MSPRKANARFRKKLHKAQGNAIIPLEQYKGCRVEIRVKCRHCGFIWKSRPITLYRKVSYPHCPHCHKLYRYRRADAKVRQRIREARGNAFTMLQLYKGMRVARLFRCNKCGHVWPTIPESIIKGENCPVYNHKLAALRNRRNYTYTDCYIRKKIHKVHGRAITMLQPYKGMRTVRLFRCNKCGHIWPATPESILKGVGCPACKQKRMAVSVEKRIRKIHNGRITMLQRYIGIQIKRLFRCNRCGHIWRTTPLAILIGHGCPICDRKKAIKERTMSIATIKRRISKVSDNSIIMIRPHKGVETKNLFLCKNCGNIWATQTINILTGEGCPRCSKIGSSKGEQMISHWLKQNIRQTFKYGYIIPKSRLHFDFWIPSRKLAIEFDGTQHFRYVPYFCSHNPKRFKKAIKRDQRKNKYCISHHITLIRIQNFHNDSNYKRLHHTINHILFRVFSAYRHHHLLTRIYRFDANHHGHLLRNRKKSA